MSDKKSAIIWMLTSAFCFACMGAMVKLAVDIPIFEKVFFRNLVGFLIAGWLVVKNRENPFKQGRNTKFLLLRSLAGFVGVIAYFYAISNLPLSDSTMLNKLSPFFVMIFAGIFLKEGFTKKKLIFVLLAFSGALLIIKPTLDLSILPAVSGVASAIFAGIAYTTVRYLKGKASSNMIVFYFSTISVIGSIPLLIPVYVTPSSYSLMLLIGTGVFAGIGQITLTKAYHKAPASEISIFNYASVVFATIIGIFIGDGYPDMLSIGGGVLIFLVAFWNFKGKK
ncbi:MAG: EamA family transporter [Candidatus Cloacimonetes bacterium 4572_65]|nr:MAG: EamA family transporter [Candidatus Cloacimonetes bacterium 4572_65]